MGLLDKTLTALGLKANEGAYRPGPYNLPVTGGWLSAEAGQNWNWWQMGHDVTGPGRSAMVEACIGAYAQTVAMCPGAHWKWSPEDGRTRVITSAICRLLRAPNAYQSISDFLMNAVRALLEDGNAYALALRNERFEIQELHLMDPRQCFPQIAVTGDVFYHLGGNPIIDRRIAPNLIVPARDVLHIRLQTPRHPLIGESPLAAAALEMAAGDAARTQQVNLFLNQARPSFVLTTDMILKAEQVEELRRSWNEQAAGMNRGGTPILTAGLKAQAIGTNARDAELAEMLKLSDAAIAHVFRVPLQVLGVGDTPYASTEALMSSWRAGGLGFMLNHVEEALGLLFKLKGQPEEYVEFDTSVLLRSAFKERVEGWVAGVKGGIFDRNAARQDFEMAPVKGGEQPWVQQQDIPLSVALDTAEKPAVPPPPPANDDQDVERGIALFEKQLREGIRA